MLIDHKTTELDIKAFKTMIPELSWVKKSRKLGTIKEMWYRGDFEDENRSITVVIRPSMRMQVTESYKNRLPTGEEPTAKQKKAKNIHLVDFGCSTQVLVDQEFVDEIDKLATPFQKKAIQKVSWS